MSSSQAQKPLQTPSTTPSKSSSRKERENLNNVSKSLQYHGLYYDEREAWDQRCPEFKDKVLEAFQSDRTSSMASASQKKCGKILEETYYSNEATFHEEMVPAILTNTCIVESKKRDLKGEIIRLAQTWGEVEGLRSQQKPYLAHGFVPGKEATKKALGITEPNPDTVFGKAQIKYVKPGAQAPLDIRVIRALECTVDWPFFIIEAKPVGTGLPAANIQAQRDCGAVIKALLKLKEFVEGPSYKEKIGAIEDFWIFSLCWNPDYAVILVHWAEVTDDKTLLFHATKVGQKFMDTDEGRSALRAYGHNIFDHGLLKHVPNMERLWAKAIKAGTPLDENFDLYD